MLLCDVLCCCSIGEYMTLAEVRDAIDKLTGAAINGSVVKVTPHVSDDGGARRGARGGGGLLGADLYGSMVKGHAVCK
jgi:hypothetical protein